MCYTGDKPCSNTNVLEQKVSNMKRILALTACLCLLIAGMAEASMCVRLDDGAALLERDGEEIIALGRYDDLVSLDESLLAALEGKKYALMDASGVLLTAAQYSELRIEGDILLAERDGLWGLLSRSGEELTEFEYTKIAAGDGDSLWAIRGNPSDVESDEIYILSAEGDERASGTYARRMAARGSEGLLAVSPSDSALWGYCDETGEMVIPARYSYAGAFCGGRAVVVLDGSYALIDASGKEIIAADYDYMELSSSGFVLAARAMEGAWVFDLNGNERAYYEDEEIAVALVGDGWSVYDGEWLWIYDRSGEVRAQLTQYGTVSEGLDGQLIFSDGAWGEESVYLSDTDKENRYQNIYPLGWADGAPVYAYMTANTGRYVNDLLGETQLSTDMDSACYGVIDAAGEICIPARYDQIFYLEEDRFLLRDGEFWQVTDSQGRIYWRHGVMQIEESIF